MKALLSLVSSGVPVSRCILCYSKKKALTLALHSVKVFSLFSFSAIYAEVVMINVKKRQRKRKTTTLRTGSLFPVYNEALAFDVADANLEDIRLQVFVKQELESSPDQVVGRVVLGTNAEGLELQHWKEAMTSKKPIAQWHSLREYHPADQAITGVVSPTHKSVISKKKLARFFSTSSEDEG